MMFFDIKKIDYGYKYQNLKKGILVLGYKKKSFNNLVEEKILKEEIFEFEVFDEGEDYKLAYSEKQNFTLELTKPYFGIMAVYFKPVLKQTNVPSESDTKIIQKIVDRIAVLLKKDYLNSMSDFLKTYLEIKLNNEETKKFMLFLSDKLPKNETWEKEELVDHYKAFIKNS